MKNSQRWIKGVCWVLLLAMFCAVLVACTTSEFELLGNAAQQLRSSESKELSTESPSADTETPTYIVCPIPSDPKYNNREFRILAWKEGCSTYWADKGSVETSLEEVLYKKNESVAERLGLELVWDFKPGGEQNREQFIEEMAVASPTDPYDAMICHNMLPYYMTAKGLTANLADTTDLDLTNCWSEEFVRENMINGRIYSLVEDNDTGLIRNMMAIFFNNEMLEKKGMESPYDLVERNEWTIDKLSEMIKDTYEDLNGNGSTDADDLYGFANATAAKTDAWFYALGYKESEVLDGKVVSLLDNGDVAQYIERMIAFYDSEDTLLNDSVQLKMFKERRVYFYSCFLDTAERLLTSSAEHEINYGIVPMPKLNPEQSHYYTYVCNSYNVWCVPYNVKDMDCSSAVLERMAFESYRLVGPVYFDQNLKLRYAPDERLASMYDLIRESVVFDVGRSYSIVLGGSQIPRFLMRSCISNPEAYSWQSLYAANQGIWNDAFDQLVFIYTK